MNTNQHLKSYQETSLKGVSCVICCHNGYRRIGNTLKALISQKETDGIKWEVLLIDNASTDGTAEEAAKYMNDFQGSQLRIIREDKLGLIHARKRGVAEARYEYISFIDDDNLVERLWVKRVMAILDAHGDVAACGGRSVPLYETTPPWWFDDYKHSLAIGVQYDRSGDITDCRGWLWGAGLTIRKKAWQEIMDNGHRFYTTGRKGRALISGEDQELCYAFRIAGWRLWYDQDLKLSHCMPENRLSWQYYRRLYFGFGMSNILMTPYMKLLRDDADARSDSWLKEIGREVRALTSVPITTWVYFIIKREGKYNTLKLIKRFGRIVMLFQLKSRYREMIRKVVVFSERCRARPSTHNHHYYNLQKA